MPSGCFMEMWFFCLPTHVLYKISTKANIQMVNMVERLCTSNLHARTSLLSAVSCWACTSNWFWYDIILVGKGNVSVLNIFLKGVCPGPEQCICWYWCNSSWSHGSSTVFCALNNINSRGLAPTIHVWKGKPIRIMALPPTSHYVVIFVKATNQRRPPPLDLCSFSLDMKGGILVLAMPHAPAGPDALKDIITCGCVAQGKGCSTQYSFYHHHITCMMVCNCA